MFVMNLRAPHKFYLLFKISLSDFKLKRLKIYLKILTFYN